MTQLANLQPVRLAVVLLVTVLLGCDGPDCQTFVKDDLRFTQIHAYALHSAQAYCMRNMLSESNVIADEAPESRVQYVVSEEPASNVQWVAVRGTDNTKNLVVDLDRIMQSSKLLDAQLFSGLAGASEELFARILPRLDPSREIRFTGHSLGGALAVILDAMLRKHGEESGTTFMQGPVITFGQPTIADGEENRVFCDSALLRVVISGDLVVKPWLDDFRNFDPFPDHVGSELVMYACDKPSWTFFPRADDAMQLALDKALCATEPTFDLGANHSLTRYLQLSRHFAKQELPEGQSLPEYAELMDCSR